MWPSSQAFSLALFHPSGHEGPRLDGGGRTGRRTAFTLIELLVVIAIIAILAGLMLPSFARAKERAKVLKVHSDLYQLGLALHMYADDHGGRVPPVRINCNSDAREHWCQLPVELARAQYLPGREAVGREANLEDPFTPGHTYKYAAPGPQLLNDEPVGHYALWVPTNAPPGGPDEGRHFSQPDDSPVRWVVWSLGPRPQSDRSRSSRAPLSPQTWYRRPGEAGVIVRFADRQGQQIKSP